MPLQSRSRPHGLTAHLLAALVALATVLAWGQAPAQPSGAMAEKLQNLPPEKRRMLKSYSPELRQKVMQLSPATRKKLNRLLSQHQRRSRKVTFRQVMHEVLADYQAAALGIATDNGELAAAAARRLADHRLPKGGLFPYLPLEMINDQDLSVLPGMNTAVEGNATKLAEAAEAGDMGTAAQLLGKVMSGCVACHKKFRGRPGVSEHLRNPGTVGR